MKAILLPYGLGFLISREHPIFGWLFFFTLFTDMFAKYKVYVFVNSEKPNVLSTFNDMSLSFCDLTISN